MKAKMLKCLIHLYYFLLHQQISESKYYIKSYSIYAFKIIKVESIQQS